MNRHLDVLRPAGNAGELAEPFRPEHERCRRTERQQDDENDLLRLDERDERGPFRNEHAERGDEHAHDAEHHEARQTRHALEQQVHVLDVAAADVVFGGADAQEQQRLGSCMEDDEQHGSPDSLGGADARAGDDQAEVGDSRVREHALRVRLGNGHERAEHECDATDEDDHGAGNLAHEEERSELDEQEDARLDHGRGVEQCRSGRRSHHRAEQPCVERHLSSFRKAGESKRANGQRCNLGMHETFEDEPVE